MTWPQWACEAETLKQIPPEKWESQGEKKEGKWEGSVGQEPEMWWNSEVT